MAEPHERHIWEWQATRDVLWAVALVVACWMVQRWAEILMPVFLGLILGYITHPPVVWAERRWGCPRLVAACLILTLLALACVGLGWRFLPLLLEQIQSFAERLPRYVDVVRAWFGWSADGDLKEVLADIRGESAWDTLRGLLSRTDDVWQAFSKFLGSASHFVFVMVLVPFFWVTFAVQYDRLTGALAELIPASQRGRWTDLAREMDQTVGAFLRGRLIIALGMGAVLAAGWWLTDVPYWFLFGMTAGVLSIVPYIAAVAVPVAILAKYAETAGQGGDVSLLSVAVWPTVVYLVVQALEGWLVTPAVQGHQLRMSATLLIFVLFVGGTYGGLLGMLLAIPLAACARILLRRELLPRWRAWAANR